MNKKGTQYLVGVVLNLILIVISFLVMLTIKSKKPGDFTTIDNTNYYNMASAFLSNFLILFKKIGGVFGLSIIVIIMLNQAINFIISLVSYKISQSKQIKASLNYIIATVLTNGLFIVFGLCTLVSVIKKKIGAESPLITVLTILGKGIPIDIVITTLVFTGLLVSSVANLVLSAINKKQYNKTGGKGNEKEFISKTN
jgi:hypothetical protein